VADIFRARGPGYRRKHRLPPYQHKLMRAIENCRTAALGGHVERCGHCAQQRISYNSCRNRHCPKCQNLARAQWLQRRQEELLPIGYFHVVFTVPDALCDLALQNKRTFYNLLLQTSAAALQSIAADPKHLGAEIGFFSVLHTWGQNLGLHPHVHCVVAGGGLSPDHARWIPSRPGFFLSVRVLSRRFRTLLLEALRTACQRGELQFRGAIEPLAEPERFTRWLNGLGQIEWVVYAKPPFGGPRHVLQYLGRYTHRVAISNQRLLAFDGRQVTFQYKDYRRAGRERSKHMKLDGEEFIRRLLLHALPPGFQRIRHYGFLASSRKKSDLAMVRQLLGDGVHPPAPSPPEVGETVAALRQRMDRCPVCRIGMLALVEILPPQADGLRKDTNDTS